MPPLSEKKRQILEEEIYRSEIRRKIEQEQVKEGEGTWLYRYLDTQQGRFVCSVVVIPIFIWLFTSLQTCYMAEAEKQAMYDRIITELRARAASALPEIRSGSTAPFKSPHSAHHSSEFANQSFYFLLEAVANDPEHAKAMSALKRKLLSGNVVNGLQKAFEAADLLEESPNK